MSDRPDHLEVGRTSYELARRMGHPNAYAYAVRLADEARSEGAQEAEAFWKAVAGSLQVR